jgi:hypothetical protein
VRRVTRANPFPAKLGHEPQVVREGFEKDTLPDAFKLLEREQRIQ